VQHQEQVLLRSTTDLPRPPPSAFSANFVIATATLQTQVNYQHKSLSAKLADFKVKIANLNK